MTTTNKTPRFCKYCGKRLGLSHKPECDLADNENAHEEFIDGLDLGVAELPPPPAKGDRFDRTPGESDENATPELSVADAQTAVAKAIARGASGVLVVALYDSGDGATDIVACGHITVTDLAMIGARLTVTAGSWDGGQ